MSPFITIFQISIVMTLFYGIYATFLCINRCSHDHWPWYCSSTTCSAITYDTYSNTNCSLFGQQELNSKTECDQFANNQLPISLYCQYFCENDNETYYETFCLPSAQVCPLTYNGCNMYQEPEMYPNLESCIDPISYNDSFDLTTVFTEYEMTKYIIVYFAMNWSMAEVYCQSEYNSHLATVISDRDIAIIKQMRTPHYYTTAIWIGLNDREIEGTWKWTDGTICSNHSNNSSCINRDHWHRDEPNDYYGEDCVAFTPQHNYLNDYDCSNKYIFLCNNYTEIDVLRQQDDKRWQLILIICAVILTLSIISCCIRKYCNKLRKLCGACRIFMELWESRRRLQLHDINGVEIENQGNAFNESVLITTTDQTSDEQVYNYSHNDNPSQNAIFGENDETNDLLSN